MGLFDIYKKNQGKNVRLWTMVGVLVLAGVGCVWLSNILAQFSPIVQYFVPLIVAAAISYIAFRYIYQRESMSDFFIATEGEMKKVAWSDKKEVIGATKVVVFTTILLAVLLFVVDVLFKSFFNFAGVIRL